MRVLMKLKSLQALKYRKLALGLSVLIGLVTWYLSDNDRASFLYDLAFGSPIKSVPLGQCEKIEGIIDTCHSLSMEISCHRQLPQRAIVMISIFFGLFGLDHLYARNIQLFLPKVFLSCFLLPFVWKKMVASLPKPISSGSSKEEEKEGSHLSYLSGIELHIAQQRAGSFHNNESDGSVVHHYKKLNTHAFHTIRTAEEAKKETYDNEYDEEYDEDDDEEYDNIDKISQFNLNLLSLFGLILMLSHVWWIIDIILWSFKFYTTGLNGNWFGNPIQQCRL